MRLSYCYPTSERIREGVRRLATVVQAETELVSVFGSGANAPAEPGRWVSSPGPDLA